MADVADVEITWPISRGVALGQHVLNGMIIKGIFSARLDLLGKNHQSGERRRNEISETLEDSRMQNKECLWFRTCLMIII